MSNGKKFDFSDEVETEVTDDSDLDTSVVTESYAISSFGIDFDVEGLIRRLKKSEIYVPHFQRSFVWNIKAASLFIESLLLGLPVPGVFLAKDKDTGKFLIIDGQQRLKSLQFFYDGFFNPVEFEKQREVFALTGVQPQFQGRTYETLDEDDKRRLDNAVIHATIIKQESPNEDEDTSLYYIFGRLNSGGARLAAQEIRSALYHGPLDDLIEELNNSSEWRAIFGKKNKRLKDQEMILRFLALLTRHEKYARPMEDFINRFCKKYQNASKDQLNIFRKDFEITIHFAHEYLGVKAFRPARSLNAAVFDSLMVGIASRLKKGAVKKPESSGSIVESLFSNAQYVASTSKATADENNVSTRIGLSISAFDKMP